MQIEKPAPPVLSRRGGCQLYLFVLCSKVLFRQADSSQTAITNFRKFLCAACIVDDKIFDNLYVTRSSRKSKFINFLDRTIECDIIIYI